MKKKYKIFLVLFILILVAACIYAYSIFKTVMGSEKITGNQGNIPEKGTELPPLTTGSSDWPNWRGKLFDGKSSLKGIYIEWSTGLEKIWEVDYLCQGQSTATWAAPVIQGNRLIVPGRDENNDLVFCLNSENGQLIWKGSYHAIAGTSHGPGPRATPFIDNDRVYTFGRSGDLVCWDLLDGTKHWYTNVKSEGGQEPDWGLSSSPLVLDDKVYVQGGGDALVCAFDKMNGKLAWKSLQGPSGYAAIVPFISDSTRLILVYHAKALSCLDANSGKELWRTTWETDYGVNATTPLVHGDTIFHTSGYDKGAQALVANKDGFKILWTNKTIAAQHSDQILIDGHLYGYSGQSTTNRGEFKCVELRSGIEKWSSKELANGTVCYADGYLICMDLKGNLFLLKPVPTGLNIIAEFPDAIEGVKSLSWTVPVIANGKLYLRYLQRLICYNIQNKP